MRINKVINFLKRYNYFLICAHTSPEPDALGAQLAFSHILKSMGKKYELINADKHLQAYSFLPGIDKIRSKPRNSKFDAAILLDCSNVARIGSCNKYLDKKIPILNIDHHISNTYFADLNIVDIHASSTCEIIYFLLKKLKIKINRDVALCLYSGIAADTGFFRYSNTTAKTHDIVSKLLKFKMNTPWLFQNIYGNLTSSELKFINRTLLKSKLDQTRKIAWALLTKNSIKKYAVKMDIADHILTALRSLEDIAVVVLFKENLKEKSIRVNLRSNGSADVNFIAQHFNGGGHPTASGITLRNITLKKAERLVIGYIRRKLA